MRKRAVSGATGVSGGFPASTAITLSAASRAIASLVEAVADPTCGSSTTFSSASSSGSTSGSCSNTSSPAAANRPLRSASASAVVSTSPPRAVLTSTAPGLNRSSRRASTRCRVCGRERRVERHKVGPLDERGELGALEAERAPRPPAAVPRRVEELRLEAAEQLRPAAKSAPDGYTLLATGMETFAINPSLMTKLSYNVSEFVPVSGYGLSNQILVVPAASPFKTLADVIAAARAKPGELNYATIGLGGSSHINMVLFESMTGLKLTPVHYRGGAPATADLLGGHVPLAFLSSQLVDPGIRSGHIRAIAVASKARLKQHPNVPTVAESGVPGFEAVSWFGVWAPAGTPRDVVPRSTPTFKRCSPIRTSARSFWTAPCSTRSRARPTSSRNSSRPRLRSGARSSRTRI